MISLIYAQLLNIRTIKRLILSLSIAPALFIFCSYYVDSFLLPPHYMLPLIAILNTTLSSEALYWLTIDEISSGIFDVILISPRHPSEILLGKTFIPISIGFMLSVLSITLNNVLAHFFPLLVWSLSIQTTFFLLVASTIACLLEFCVLLLRRKEGINLHSLLLVVSILLLASAYYFLEKQVLIIYLIIISLSLICPTYISLTLLKRRQQINSYRENTNLSNLFHGKKISIASAFFRKNLTILRDSRFFFAYFACATINPIVVAYIMYRLGINHYMDVFVIMNSTIPAIINSKIVLHMTLQENKCHINEQFQIANVHTILISVEKAFSAALLSTIGSIISLGCFFVIGMPVTIRLVLCTILNNFLSALICSVLFRNISTYKTIHFNEALISLICISLQLFIII